MINNKLYIFLSLYFLLVNLDIISVHAQNPRKHFRAGEDFLEYPNYTDAVDQFSRAIELKPDYGKAYQKRAEAFEGLEMLADAAADYDRAAAFFPKNPELLVGAGRVYHGLGKYEPALDRLDKALDLDMNNIEACQEKIEILIELEQYSEALNLSDLTLLIRESAQNYFLRGVIHEKLGNSQASEEDYLKAYQQDDKNMVILMALTDLQRRSGKTEQALLNANIILDNAPGNRQALILRSRLYADLKDFPGAIDDASSGIFQYESDIDLYILRASYYSDFTQYTAAINDYSKVLLIDPERADVYIERGLLYEEVGNFQAAINDYKKVLELEADLHTSLEDADLAGSRIYNLRRETNSPKIVLSYPQRNTEGYIELLEGSDSLLLHGYIDDESEISSFSINGHELLFTEDEERFEFHVLVDIMDAESVRFETADIYDNAGSIEFPFLFNENQPPEVSVVAPYASDDGQIFLDKQEAEIIIEGYITDENLISSIMINDMMASYIPDEVNPSFSANINIANQNEIIITAVDIYDNETESRYLINRESAILSENNPMGKTWVVFIENSEYHHFMSLQGPKNDISLMKTALSRYQIHSVIHKKDLSKNEMERFFSIELRDLVKSNRVNSLMIWFAGHGDFFNETGYWIPVDAKPSDEFSYYNVNALKASLYSYINNAKHILIISDACQTGPGFYLTERSDLTEMRCDDRDVTELQSSQVFTSAGNETAIDNSGFSTSFASSLRNSTSYCLPVESVVKEVADYLEQNSSQKSVFGKIAGLSDEGGTFFFIRK